MLGIFSREALLIRNTSLADPALESSLRAVTGPIAGVMVSAIRYCSSPSGEPDIFYDIDVALALIIDTDRKQIFRISVSYMR
jgi:hypothetical protein